MLVKMKVQTTFEGTVLRIGDEVNVNDTVAQRWAKCGIADTLQKAEKLPKDMSAKELYKLCVDNGIEVAEKQPKAVYLEALGITE